MYCPDVIVQYWYTRRVCSPLVHLTTTVQYALSIKSIYSMAIDKCRGMAPPHFKSNNKFYEHAQEKYRGKQQITAI